MSECYSSDERTYILNLVRTTIKNKLKDLVTKPEFRIEKLKKTLSCFVTLHSSNGSLRGCIGNIMAFEPLEQNIINNAKNAAFNDPRFPQLESVDELNSLIIEVSVLTKPTPVNSYKDIELGKHGIILKKNSNQSVFLPQVAIEQNWNMEETLTHLSLKAGLMPGDWRDSNTNFETFEAIIISEK